MIPYIQETIIGVLSLIIIIQTSRAAHWRAKADWSSHEESLIEEINYHRERVDELLAAILKKPQTFAETVKAEAGRSYRPKPELNDTCGDMGGSP